MPGIGKRIGSGGRNGIRNRSRNGNKKGSKGRKSSAGAACRDYQYSGVVDYNADLYGIDPGAFGGRGV